MWRIVMRCKPRLFAALALLIIAVAAAGAETISRSPIPSGVTARASGDVVEATLIGPTTRYRHFVLGTPYEAAGLRVRTGDGRILEILLPVDSVFEDRQPRIADLDGDGRNEVVLVRSRGSTGSSLAVLGLRDGALTILAESTPNGSPQRWLNPAGIGRFLNNGRRQVTLVRMPHVVGRLEFWDFDGKMLRLHSTLNNTSNHRIGSDQMNLSAVIARGAGQTDLLAVPDFSRRNLRIISANPAPRELASFPLNAPVDGDLRVNRNQNGISIRVPLADGHFQDILLSREFLSRLPL
jgi:hypothetical protein